jgi:hypothetical protein
MVLGNESVEVERLTIVVAAWAAKVVKKKAITVIVHHFHRLLGTN